MNKVSKCMRPGYILPFPLDPNFSYYRSLSDTVSDIELFLLTILISCFSIFLMIFCLSDRQLTSISQEKLKDVAALLISFFTSFSVAGLVIQILKILVTKPRPSMFYLCNYQGFRDAVDSGNFTDYLSLTSPQTIGDTSHCWDQDYVPDCIYSFPSGHSALAFVSFFWLVEFFLHFTRRFPFMKNLKWLLWLPMVLATWIAYSRIYDYKHSELDVVTGALIGVASAHYFFGDFVVYFQQEHDKKRDDLSEELV